MINLSILRTLRYAISGFRCLQAVVNEDTKGDMAALQRELGRRAGVIADLQRSLQALEVSAQQGPAGRYVLFLRVARHAELES